MVAYVPCLHGGHHTLANGSTLYSRLAGLDGHPVVSSDLSWAFSQQCWTAMDVCCAIFNSTTIDRNTTNTTTTTTTSNTTTISTIKLFTVYTVDSSLTRLLAVSYMSPSTLRAYCTKLLIRRSRRAVRSGVGNIACTLHTQKHTQRHLY